MYRVYRQIVDAATVFPKYFGKLSKNIRECKNPADGGLWWADGGRMKKPRKILPGFGSLPVCHRPAAVRLRPPRQASLPAESAFRRRPLLCLAFGEKCHVVNHRFAFRGLLSLIVVTRVYL
jgi:hypothetical protein